MKYELDRPNTVSCILRLIKQPDFYVRHRHVSVMLSPSLVHTNSWFRYAIQYTYMLYITEIYKAILLYETLILIRRGAKKLALTLVVSYKKRTALYSGLPTSKMTPKIRPSISHIPKSFLPQDFWIDHPAKMYALGSVSTVCHNTTKNIYIKKM